MKLQGSCSSLGIIYLDLEDFSVTDRQCKRCAVNGQISHGDKLKYCIKVQHIHLQMKNTSFYEPTPSSNKGWDYFSSYFFYKNYILPIYFCCLFYLPALLKMPVIMCSPLLKVKAAAFTLVTQLVRMPNSGQRQTGFCRNTYASISIHWPNICVDIN